MYIQNRENIRVCWKCKNDILEQVFLNVIPGIILYEVAKIKNMKENHTFLDSQLF
jgi:hypothetical protein